MTVENNNNRLSGNSLSFFYLCLDYLKNHSLYAIISSFVIVLSYGFYATKYTFNLDQLVPEYYDGNVLISAGRWAAPLIHFFTNWMEFSPFWHTVLMMLLLWISGLCWIILFKKASFNQIKDKALFVFWCLFPICPMITEQLTYPILNIALAYVLTPIAIWLLYPIFFEKNLKIINLLIAALFMLVSIDMYESFAPVFLTGFCAVLILQYVFSAKPADKPFVSLVSVLLKVAFFLAGVIILDFLISKIICFISTGSFEFWYKNNSLPKWFTYGGLLDSVVWMLRSVLSHYFIAGAGNFSVLFFDVMLLAAITMSILFSIKKKSLMPILLFAGLCISTVSLCLIEGFAPSYRTEQALPVFVAFIFMLLFEYALNRKIIACFLSIITVILVLNESQIINNYAVRNYEIFEYGYSRLREIGNALEYYNTSEKPVAFINNANARVYPKTLYTPSESTNPLYTAFRDASCKFWDTVLPEKYFTDMDSITWSYAEIKIADANSLIQSEKSKTIIYYPLLTSLDFNQYYIADGYKALKRMGYDIIPCSQDEYEEANNHLIPEDNTIKFNITETDTMIIVQLMSIN